MQHQIDALQQDIASIKDDLSARSILGAWIFAGETKHRKNNVGMSALTPLYVLRTLGAGGVGTTPA